jgi:23S rRNA (cytidine1920-2'-O)/16S rRNA (cytidine1409-2'-O)-methyltransferase
MTKSRLDQLLLEKGMASSRHRARAMILAGKVYVNGLRVDKAGARIAADAEIECKGGDSPYVSRGGLKLQAALDAFPVQPQGKVCLDVGASTGGFTDCLLQAGAARVFAVDVGYGQLAWSLRQDARVIALERTNIRYLDPSVLDTPAELATVDVSFISLKIVIPAVLPLLTPDAELIVLVKPQFEVGKGKVGKGGVVRDPSLHEEVLEDLTAFFAATGLHCSQPLPSPVLGPKGNREFLVHCKRSSD